MLNVLRDTARLLTFRLSREEFAAFTPAHLVFGLLCCWLAGIGRFWGTPDLPWTAHLGLGSLVYPWLLALVVAVLIHPLTAWRGVPYLSVVAFIALTGPIAFAYAPLTPEAFGVEGASVLRAGAMSVVSAWRLALLAWFLVHLAGLSWFEAGVVLALLLTGLVSSLVALNLDGAIFNLMRGMAPAQTIADDSYALLVGLGLLALLALPVTGLSYLSLLWLARTAR